jgi:hypothetical protein
MYAIEKRKSYSHSLELVFRYLDSFNETIFETLFRSKQNDPRNLGAYIRSKREEANVSFYERVWTLEELKEELRTLAKDMEIAQLYDPPKEEYSFLSSYGHPSARELLERKMKAQYLDAVRLELIDSIGDLQRKADYLLRKLMQEDYIEFVLTMEQEGMEGIIRKLNIGAQLNEALGGVAGTSINAIATRAHDLAMTQQKLTELYPDEAELIENLVENERMKLAK